MEKNLSQFLSFRRYYLITRSQLLLIALLFRCFTVSAQNGSHLFQLVKDINPTPTSALTFNDYSQWTDVNGTLYFVLKNRQLWLVTPSESTAVFLKEFESINNLSNINGALFFSANDGLHGTELWKTDGTPNGTTLVKDIRPGSTGSDPFRFTEVNGLVFFSAHDGSRGSELWKSDGTEAGTMRLTEDARIQLTGFPDLTSFKGMMYFLAQTDINTTHIFRVGKTPERAESFIQSSEGYYALTHLTTSGNYLYYINQGALWRTDGVNQQVINGIFYNTDSSNPEHITLANGVMYFRAFDGMSYGLWKSDGTNTGTSLIYRFEEGVVSLTVSGNYLYYWANSIDSDSLQLGLKLWRTDLTTDVTTWVSDINKGGGDYLAELEDVNGTLFFSIEVPIVTGQEFPREAQLWKTTGTLSSTEYIKTFNEAGLPPTFLTNVNGILFFSAVTDPNVGEELWKSDGTPAGTVMVKKINPNPLEPSAPSRLININNTLFFNAYTGQYELWKSDGTEAGTVRVKDINPLGLVNLDDTLYFYSSNELWKSDGTEAGTVKVASFTAPEGARVYAIYVLGKINNDIIVGTSYVSWTFLPGAIWKTNGTEEGTEVILSPVDNLTRFSNIVAKDNIIYFTGPVNNRPDYDLWRTDGTTCGTFAVATEGNPGNLIKLNDLLYLSLTDQKFGSS